MENIKEGEFLSDIAGKGWEQILTKPDDINALANHWTTIFSSLLIGMPRFVRCASQEGAVLELIKDIRSWHEEELT